MDKQRRKLLDDILKYANKRGIVIPDDILLEISKQDAEKSLELLKKASKEVTQDEIFGLMRAGLVPAPLQPGLTLKSQGWERVAEVPYPTFSGGGGGSGGGVKDHNLLNNLDYPSAGHTGFAPALGADDNYVTDAEKLALHPSVTLDVNADTLLSLAAQALGLDTQSAGTVLAGPASGANAVPTFRTLLATDIPTPAPDGTYLISGGGVTWQNNYIYTVAAGTGYINGVLYGWAQQNITLDAADALLDRIDVVAVNTSGTAVKVTGVAAADPSEPVVDPSTQLELAFVLVTANTTEPVGITSELIYAENAGSPTEWAWTTSGVGFNVNSATNPRTGAKDIEGTNVAANAYALAARGAGTIDPSDYTQLVLYIRFKNSWNASRYLQIQLQNAGVKKGNALRISNGQFGLVGTNTTDYQAVIIPVLQFAVPSGTLINQVRIIDVGGSIGFYIDDVSITTGGSGGTIITGITQEEADARYSQLGHAHDASVITFTPAVATDWDGDADPGNTDDALDQLAERVDDIEATGGSVYTKWDPMCPPASATSQDDEFDDASLNVKWTEFDPGGTQTPTEGDLGLQLAQTTHAGDSITGIYQAIPSGDFSIITRIYMGGPFVNIRMGGLVIWQDATDSANGDLLFLCLSIATGSAYKISWHKYSAYNAWATEAASLNINLQEALYLRMRRNGTNYYADYSRSGIDWWNLSTTTLGYTPAHFGLGINNVNSGSTLIGYFPFFRYIASDVTAFGLLNGRRI